MSDSSEKKKSADKKKTGPKKPAQTTEAPRSEAGQRVPLKEKTKAKPKAKKTAPVKREISIKELLLRRYDAGMARKPAAATPHKEKAPEELPDAPPFFTARDTDENERMRALLFRNFDLSPHPVEEKTDDVVPVQEVSEIPPPPAGVLCGKETHGGYALKLGLSGLAILMTIIIATSLSNRRSFFLKDVGGTVEVWRGKFAPIGSERILTLNGMSIPEPFQDIYSKAEVYQLVFDHLQAEADALLYDAAGPDFSKINGYLRQARTYAPTEAERVIAQRRLDSIAFLVLLHKVDVALIKGKRPDLEAAKASLQKGAGYAAGEYERGLIARRMSVLDETMSRLSGK